MGTRAGRRTALALGVVTSLLVPTGAAAQDESADGPPSPPFTTDSFAFAGSSAPRAVRLTEALRSGARSGVVTVRLRNRTKLEGALRLRYFPYDGGPEQELLQPGQDRDDPASARVVEADGATNRTPRLGARDYALVRLRFTLPEGQALEDVDGFVVAQLAARGRFGPTARLRIRGAAPRVTFDPPVAAIAIERYEPTGADEATKVVVRGPDAPILANAQEPIARQIVRDGEASVTVTVDPPVRDGGVYVSDVRVSDADGLDTGDFSGDVPLTAGRGGPVLRAEAKVRFSLLVLAVVVLLGALVGGLWRRYTNAGRDARILRMRLLAAYDAYDAATKVHGHIASHDLRGWLEPLPADGPAWSYPGTRGLAGMLWHLRTARTTRDVDVQRYRVRETIRNLERWQALEPVAHAAEVLLAERVPRRGTHGLLSIRQCVAYREVRRLLDDARVPPDPTRPPARTAQEWDARQAVDDAAASTLVSELAAYTAVLALALQTWRYLCAFDEIRADLPDEVLDEVTRCELTEVEAAHPRATQDPAALKALRLDLRARLDRLEELWPADRGTPRRADTGLADGVLEAAVRNPCAIVGTTGVARRRRDWAGIVQADWAWTIISGLVATAVYAAGAAAIGDGTWGGDVADYVTAFGAGFAGEVVPWRRLPVLRGLDGGIDEDPPPKPPTPAPAAAVPAEGASATGEEREAQPV